MKKIMVTGGAGRFAQHINDLTKDDENFQVLLPTRKEMNFEGFWDCEKYFYANQKDFDYVIHSGGLSSPMRRHKENPTKSIKTNIVGSCNIAMMCERFDKKMIYISTNYVYPGLFGNQDEEYGLKPFNNYGWSKLGGECVTRLITDSLILRCALCDIPFRHTVAFDDVYRSSITHKDVADIILKVKDEVGTINIGGKYQSVYEFVSEHQVVEKGNGSHIAPTLKLSTKKLESIISE